MIEPMKKVFIVVQTSHKREMLKALRKAGILHVKESPATVRSDASVSLSELSEKYACIENLFAEYPKEKKAVQKEVDAHTFQTWVDHICVLLQERKDLDLAIAADQKLLERLKGWGNFHLDEIKALQTKGITLSFYTLGAKELEALDDGLPYIQLRDVEGQKAIAVVGEERDIPGGKRFELPDKDPEEIRSDLIKSEERRAKMQEELAKSLGYRNMVHKAILVNNQALAFQEKCDGMGGDEKLSFLCGYLPSRLEESFSSLAKKEGWGYALEDPEEDDNPPTLLRYPKGFSLMQPIYNILGTYPGYRERDISVPFLLFFLVFFAMIIGDGGYGLIFLLAGIGMCKAQRKVTDASMLVIVLALATIIWGAVTGTWFGSTWLLEHVTLLRKMVIPTLANVPQLFLKKSGEMMDAKTVQDHVMNFCFLLGVMQLALACVMNIIYKLPRKNLSWISDLAWFVDITVLYQLILSMLLPSIKLPFMLDTATILKIVAFGYLVVILFRNQDAGKKFSDGVKEGLMGFLPTFLDTISCFSNIMSYIRLFAVGMAGFAISQSFNSMALGVAGSSRVLGFIGFMVIILLGHTLNIVMCLLSVIVHGVRLNILEFSNQLGMEWSGYKYDPFRETVKIEN